MKKRIFIGIGFAICLLGVMVFIKYTEDNSKAEYLQKRDSVYLQYAKAKQSIRNTLLDIQNDGGKIYDYFNSDEFERSVALIEHMADDSITISDSYGAKTDDSDKYQNTVKELREYQEAVRNLPDLKSEIPNRIALLLLFLTDESDNITNLTERLKNPKNYQNVNDVSVEWT